MALRVVQQDLRTRYGFQEYGFIEEDGFIIDPLTADKRHPEADTYRFVGRISGGRQSWLYVGSVEIVVPERGVMHYEHRRIVTLSLINPDNSGLTYKIDVPKRGEKKGVELIDEPEKFKPSPEQDEDELSLFAGISDILARDHVGIVPDDDED